MRALIIFFGIVASLLGGELLREKIVRDKERQEIKPYITYSRLMYHALKCDDYRNQNHAWPTSNAQLSAFRADLKDGTDMWGRDFVIIPYNELLGYGKIISYGQDGKPGGKTEADQDIEVRFPTDANTAWNNQMGQGLKKPYLRIQ